MQEAYPSQGYAVKEEEGERPLIRFKVQGQEEGTRARAGRPRKVLKASNYFMEHDRKEAVQED